MNHTQTTASLQHIKALILDMDGVLWKSTEAIGNLPEIFRTLDELNILYTFATNNATRDEDQYLEKLSSFGLQATREQIVNSSIATLNRLLKEYPQGGGIFIIGESGLSNILARGNFFHQEENPLCVVVGMDQSVTYEKMSKAALLINHGTPFFGTNPDKSFPTPHGETIGTGAILAAIEAATDTPPLFAENLFADMMDIALERMGTKKEETLVVGDRYETDILGGMNANCPTALVLSGVTSKDKVDSLSPQPTYIFENLTAIVDLLKEKNE